MKRINKKGSVYAWIVVTCAVFIVAMIWILFTQAVIKVQAATNETLADPNYAQSYNTIILVWKYWPIILLVGLIIVGVILSLRKEPYTDFGNL